jgi:hypothetical protein
MYPKAPIKCHENKGLRQSIQEVKDFTAEKEKK